MKNIEHIAVTGQVHSQNLVSIHCIYLSRQLSADWKDASLKLGIWALWNMCVCVCVCVYVHAHVFNIKLGTWVYKIVSEAYT